MSKFFVTGAMGFIGYHWCHYLLERGHTVYGLDLAPRMPQLLDYDNFYFAHDTIKNEDLVSHLVDKSDIICHFAGIATPGEYVKYPRKVIDITAVSAIKLLDMCRFKDKLVFFTSTSEVYGKNSQIPFKEDDDRVLGSTMTRRWCYSTSKALIEHYLDALAAGRELEHVTTRLFNVYGPHLTGRVVDAFLNSAAEGKDLTIHGDGQQTRCFTYVDDVMDGFYRLITTPECRNNVFNIGTPKEHTINQLAETIREVCNPSINVKYMDHKEEYGSSYEDIPRRVPDIGKINSFIGWEPTTSLEDGLRRSYVEMGNTPAK